MRETEMKSQEAMIWKHLRREPITPLVALKEYGCFRLAARIFDLRSRGVPIVTDNITRLGKTFAQYRIEKHGTG
jgi:hypothetical protein